MLTQMLIESDTLTNYTLPNREIILRLASMFQSSTQYLFMAPEELYESTNLGTVDKWNELMLLQETKNYIKSQMAFIAQISQRKSFLALVKSAIEGNHQASKQVQELSGVLNQQDTNRTIVLHHIPRADNKETKEVTN